MSVQQQPPRTGEPLHLFPAALHAARVHASASNLSAGPVCLGPKVGALTATLCGCVRAAGRRRARSWPGGSSPCGAEAQELGLVPPFGAAQVHVGLRHRRWCLCLHSVQLCTAAPPAGWLPAGTGPRTLTCDTLLAVAKQPSPYWLFPIKYTAEISVAQGPSTRAARRQSTVRAARSALPHLHCRLRPAAAACGRRPPPRRQPAPRPRAASRARR